MVVVGHDCGHDPLHSNGSDIGGYNTVIRKTQHRNEAVDANVKAYDKASFIA